MSKNLLLPSWKLAVLLAGVAFIMNILFVGLHYLGDLTPVEKAVSNIKEAISTNNIVPEDYPVFRYGIGTPYVLVGIDQFTDCNTVYQMSMYRDQNALKNAVVPGIAEPSAGLKKSTRRCERAIGLATGKYAADKNETETKARLWHGAKAVFLLLTPLLTIFQMREFLQQTTYLLYMMTGVLFALGGVRQLLCFLPFGVFGILFSGIPYFSDFSNGLPYMIVLFGVVILLIVARWSRSLQALAITLTITGSLHAFFFVTDGAEMLAIPLVLVALYFGCLHTLPRKERLIKSLFLLSVYIAAFAGSILIKQIFSILALGFHQVVSEFVDIVKFRLSGNMYGTPITVARTLENQFGYYLNEIFYSHEIYFFVQYSSLAAWSVGLSLFTYRLIDKRDGVCLDAGIFILAGLAVLFRYIIMREHSYEHAAFVSRYIFVFFASGWGLFLFLLQKQLTSETETETMAIDSVGG